MLYALPTNFLSSATMTLDGYRMLFGLFNQFGISSPGTHQVFPYNTGGSTFNTSSTETPSVGQFRYRGLLLGDVDVLREEVFEKLGDFQTKVRLLITDNATGQTILHADLWDYRIGSAEVESQIMGNAGALHGSFSITFRKYTPLAF